MYLCQIQGWSERIQPMVSSNRTTVYNRDVIFREFRMTSKAEEVKEKKLEKIEFNWNKESHNSDKSTESKEELETQTPVMRRSGRARKQPDRYSPLNFHSYFALSSTEEEYPQT